MSPEFQSRQLLHLDSSARITQSDSRQLTQHFVQHWQQANPNSRVIYRDLGRNPIPHLDETWVAAYETAPVDRTPAMNQAIVLSNQLIDELMAADCYVLGVPMYNLGIPSSLKAYIDQIVRRDRTVTFQDGLPQGALQNKKMLVVITRKFSYRPESGRADRDFQAPFLRAIFGVLGITDVMFIYADRLADPQIRQQSLIAAKQQLDQLATVW
ncbi:MAG: NAD(P)H-dependent oxidoreductase [Elainella sp. Prado103]|jgi:FMN-dependent NADH-azoreductase|nr:NAD(P)H-dependent oxidoreductase [Elainella sp. Prado103]